MIFSRNLRPQRKFCDLVFIFLLPSMDNMLPLRRLERRSWQQKPRRRPGCHPHLPRPDVLHPHLSRSAGVPARPEGLHGDIVGRCRLGSRRRRSTHLRHDGGAKQHLDLSGAEGWGLSKKKRPGFGVISSQLQLQKLTLSIEPIELLLSRLDPIETPDQRTQRQVLQIV